MSWTHLWTTRWSKKACKEHHASILCYDVIAIGDAYVRRTGVREGELDSFPMHPDCEAVTRSWDEMDSGVF